MAKKKKKAKDEAAAERAAAAPSETSPRLMRKTYLMTDDLIRRVERQAEAAGVGINEDEPLSVDGGPRHGGERATRDTGDDGHPPHTGRVG